MTLNTSSKICISKRLTITSLLLIMVGFSVVVFSTLSSSVNKTTASKAAGAESTAMQDFGGKNNPCAINPDTKEYYCNADTSLVCDGPLEFWLSTQTTRDKIMSDKKTMLEKGPKCLPPEEVPMGGEGQICRPIGPVKGQCDSGVCVNLVGDKWPTLSSPYRSYLNTKYKGYDLTYFEWAMRQYFHVKFKMINDGSGGYASTLAETYGVCLPDKYSKVESCGDVGQKACKNELGQDFCFGDYFPNLTNNICIQKPIIKNKDLIRCDNGSSSCNDFCASNNAKCVETCEVKVLSYMGGDEEPRETVVKAGLFEQEQIGGVTQPRKSGTCNQKEAPSYISNGNQFSFRDVCSRAFNTYCCCDKK